MIGSIARVALALCVSRTLAITGMLILTGALAMTAAPCAFAQAGPGGIGSAAPSHGAAPANPPSDKKPAAKKAAPHHGHGPANGPQAGKPPAKPAAPKPADAKPPEAKTEPPKPVEAGVDAGAPPHFESLHADKVYLRTGPGSAFQIQWTYVRRGLPVEVLATFEAWRKIRDPDGTEGWVHQLMLTRKRSVIVVGDMRDLRKEPAADAPIVARFEAGVIAELTKCDPLWCRISSGGYDGWMKRDEIWGVLAGETIE